MPDLTPLTFLVLTLIVLVSLTSGFLIGFAVKSRYQYKITLAQNRGEASVRKVIVSNFPAPKNHLLNNVTVPCRDGTTQIDHVLISTKGIFVIETKDYSGWIFGDEESKQWTQILYRVKNKFQNPIRQNFLHVKAIEQLLDFLPKEEIHSIVVFTGDARFKTAMPKGVVYLHQLNEYLKNFQDETIPINRVEFCVGRLECKRYEATNLTDIQHQAYLAKKFGKSIG